MHERHFAVDVEGSHGKPVRPGISNLISIGLVVVGNPDEHLYLELKPYTTYWDSETEAIHRMTRAYLLRHGVDPYTALCRIYRWVRDVCGGADAVFDAMPLTYDWELFDLACRDLGVGNPFHRTADGRVLYRRLHGMEKHEDVRREQFEREFPSDVPHTHHALADAFEYEERLRQLYRALGAPWLS